MGHKDCSELAWVLVWLFGPVMDVLCVGHAVLSPDLLRIEKTL